MVILELSTRCGYKSTAAGLVFSCQLRFNSHASLPQSNNQSGLSHSDRPHRQSRYGMEERALRVPFSRDIQRSSLQLWCCPCKILRQK
ncbi:hypothetical protein TNCV_4057971 [Trichonephila clavipes]|nr:hypothetical protein TNCV_4057971 [Trichonephila clavipes]